MKSPKYLECETHFILKINENSKKLTNNRGDRDVHKSLFQESVYLHGMSIQQTQNEFWFTSI